MARYGYLIFALLIGFGGLIAAYCRAQKFMRSENQSHSVWDYVLLWPLLFDKTSADLASRRADRLLTTREIVGWLVVLVVIVVAVVFAW